MHYRQKEKLLKQDFILIEDAVPRYESRLFRESGIRHAFFTRRGGVSEGIFGSLNFAVGIGKTHDSESNVLANYGIAASVFGLGRGDVCRSYQTHTSRVDTVGENERGTGITKPPFDHGVDGLVTREKDLLLSVRTADCVPILLCDGEKTVCAAVHAGWRGTLGGITVEALGKMLALGADKSHIMAAIGPCIGQCCYEVGSELYDGFTRCDSGYSDFFLPRGEKFMLDLSGLNAYILVKNGIPPEHISECNICTRDDGYDFFSHRRSGSDRGTMSAFITL